MKKQDLSSLSCVVMASGLGRRFGSNKLLARLNNKTLIEHTLSRLQNAGLHKLLVVTRSQEVFKLVQSLSIPVLLHKLPYQSDTVALGVKYWLKTEDIASGLLFITGDQPLLEASTLKALAEAYLDEYQTHQHKLIMRLGKMENNQTIPGNPVIFSPELFPELLQLPQDQGGSSLCKKYPDIVKILTAEPQELLDIDTPADLEQARQILQKK